MGMREILQKEAGRCFFYFSTAKSAGTLHAQRELAKDLGIPDYRCFGSRQYSAGSGSIRDMILTLNIKQAYHTIIVKNVYCLGEGADEIREQIIWLHDNHYRLCIYDIYYYDRIETAEVQEPNRHLTYTSPKDYYIFLGFSPFMKGGKRISSTGIPRPGQRGPVPITLTEFPESIQKAFRDYCTNPALNEQYLAGAFENAGIKVPSRQVCRRLIHDMDEILYQENKEDTHFEVFRSRKYRMENGLPIRGGTIVDQS